MTWISVREAAELYGLNAEYFRRKFCDPGGVLDQMHALRQRKGQRRSLKVSLEVITLLISQERGTK